jgi:hypothetical protein
VADVGLGGGKINVSEKKERNRKGIEKVEIANANKNFLDRYMEFESVKTENKAEKTIEKYKGHKSKHSQIIKRIFISPVEGISEELEKDLAMNGADRILKRQKFRKMDPDH